MNIAFIGKAAAGKTTSADRLVEAHGYTRIGFADPLRDLGKIHSTTNPNDWRELVRLWVYRFHIPDVLIAADLATLEHGILEAFGTYPVVEGKNRPLLQNIGTHVGRGIDDHIWVRLALARAEAAGTDVALDDCRFENEAHALKGAGWLLSYVWARPETLDARYAALYGAPMTPEQKAHPSEATVPKLRPLCQYVIHNDGDDLDVLYSEVDFLAHCSHLTKEMAI